MLALNPVIAAMLEPYSSRVCIVPWGMDPARFPWPPPEVSEPDVDAGAKLTTLFMAAVAGEFIKGFHVAHEACRILRQSRSDFELVVTFDPPGRIDEFTRSVGWCSLADLPRHYRAADICLVPTIAQDSLSRTSVEAMASGIPVVASRIGGLPYTVTDGVTGLLCEPGDPVDLARQIARLLDDPNRCGARWDWRGGSGLKKTFCGRRSSSGICGHCWALLRQEKRTTRSQESRSLTAKDTKSQESKSNNKSSVYMIIQIYK